MFLRQRDVLFCARASRTRHVLREITFSFSVQTTVAPLRVTPLTRPATSDGRTPLILACRGGHERCARALLEKGARKDVRTDRGSTALSLAQKNGHNAVCALLQS